MVLVRGLRDQGVDRRPGNTVRWTTELFRNPEALAPYSREQVGQEPLVPCSATDRLGTSGSACRMSHRSRFLDSRLRVHSANGSVLRELRGDPVRDRSRSIGPRIPMTWRICVSCGGTCGPTRSLARGARIARWWTQRCWTRSQPSRLCHRWPAPASASRSGPSARAKPAAHGGDRRRVAARRERLAGRVGGATRKRRRGAVQ